MRKNYKEKWKTAWRDVYGVCKKPHTVSLLLCALIVLYSPAWGGFLIYALWAKKKALLFARAYASFWLNFPLTFFLIGFLFACCVQSEREYRQSRSALLQGKEKKRAEITYPDLFWLFLFGSIVGVLLEGTFCRINKGHWESHVVSVFAPYNILYGLGAVAFYVGAVKLQERHIVYRVAVMTVAATVLELLCGLLLRNGLGMRAWNYQNSFLNYKGLICVGFSFCWGIAAFAFCKLYPRIHRVLQKFVGKGWKIACAVLSVCIAFDLGLTAVSIVRWSERHYGIEAKSTWQVRVDEAFPDEWMSARFIEWQFLDTLPSANSNGK